MKVRAIIIGASSGIGRELAKLLAHDGYVVGLSGRRTELLWELAAELPGEIHVKTVDVAQVDAAMAAVRELILEMGGLELMVICAGIGFINPALDWFPELQTIQVNVSGFMAMANVGWHHFERQGGGHLVGISSLAAIRGHRSAPAYNASKAFMSSYLEGLRNRAVRVRLPIVVTDIQPGFVNTAMAQGEGLFWVASPAVAARQILTAIKQRRRHAYVTRRWRLIAWLLKVLPDYFYDRL